MDSGVAACAILHIGHLSSWCVMLVAVQCVAVLLTASRVPLL
jgi:hypothetical protein